MRTIRTAKEVRGGIETVWQVMTDRRDLSWRGDLVQLQVRADPEGDILIETLRGNLTARFRVTREEPPRAYEQRMTGEMVSRSWGFELEETAPERTRIVLVEHYWFKSRLLEFLSYLYLHQKAGQRAQLKELAQRLDRLAGQTQDGEMLTQ